MTSMCRRITILATLMLLVVVPATRAQTDLGALEPDRYGCEADRLEQGGATDDHMGHVLASGDWNNDGFADLLTSGYRPNLAPCENQPEGAPFVGTVWLFLGNATGTSSTPVRTFENVPLIPDFATPVAFVGDIDDDGGEDFAIGLPHADLHGPGENSGVVWIFLSEVGPSPTPATIDMSDAYTLPDVTIVAPVGLGHWSLGDQPHFGFSIALAGDVNNDGFEDLVIGAPGSPQDPNSRGFDCAGVEPPPLIPGRAFIYTGTDPANWSSSEPFEYWASLGGDTGRAGDRFGWSVAGVGKVEGSGDLYDDVMVGAPQVGVIGKLKYNSVGSGYAHLYRGQSTAPGSGGLTPVEVLPESPEGEEPWMFGFSLAGGVSLDSSVGTEVLVGCPGYSVDSDSQGAVYAYSWDAGTSSLVPTFEDLEPIKLSTTEPGGTIGAYQDSQGQFGWALASFSQPGFAGQYDALAFDPLSPEFLVSAFVNENTVEQECGVDQGGSMSGRVYVVSLVVGQGNDPDRVDVQAVFKGEEGRMRLGIAVATGDFDDDGLLDVAAGGSGYTGTSMFSEIGRLYVFHNTTDSP